MIDIDPADFPRLESLGYEETSSPTDEYNCLAFAAGIDDEWWEPNRGVWPEGIGEEDSLANLIEVYRRYGYECCADGKLEAGYYKIVLYGIEHGGYTSYEHAARLGNDGRWYSKLGPDEDIAHASIEAVEGPLYGRALQYMRRAIQ